MAKGTDSEEFMLLTGTRTGLKRELKAQSEGSRSFGRTRGGKLQESPISDGDSEDLGNKRIKRWVSEEDEQEKNDVEKISVEDETLDVSIENPKEETLNDSVETPNEGEIKGDLAESERGEEPKNEHVRELDKEELKSDLLNSPRAEEPESNGVNVETSIAMDDDSRSKNAVVEKPPRRFTRSASKGNEQQTMIVDEVQNSLPEKPKRRFTRSVLERKDVEMVMDENKEVEKALVETPKKWFTRSASESKDVEMVMDGTKEVEKALVETPRKRFTRSALEPKDVEMVTDGTKEASMETPRKLLTCSASEPEAEETVENKEVVNTSMEKPKLETEEKLGVVTENLDQQNVSSEKPEITSSALETKAEELVMDGDKEMETTLMEKPNVELKDQLVVTTENSDQQNVSSEKPTKRFARVALEVKPELIVTAGNSEEQNVSSEKPMRRFTRSLLEPKAEPTVTNEKCEEQNVSSEKLAERPMRRFTRSLLEPKAEPIVMDCNNEQHNTVSEEQPRRFTRSALKPKDEQTEISEDGYGGISPNWQGVATCACLYCKRPLTGPKRIAQVCNSCLETRKAQASPAHKTGVGARSKLVLDSTSPSLSSQNRSQGKITRKDLRLHKLVFEEDGLPDGTELAYYIHGKKLLEGYKKGALIFCRCCNSEVSPSQFEAHAGHATRRKPYLNIYTSNGVSLHELSLSLSKGRKFSANDNDDLCGICADFGDLLLCDGCPRAFHRECVGQLSIPRGDWYCPYCQNMFHRDRACPDNANAMAAGRIEGMDPIEQISKRCIRIVETTETEVGGGCALCRCDGFSKSGFGPRTVIICDQCEKEFHVGCLKDHKMADLQELPIGNWFCSTDCSRIRTALQKLIIRGSEKLPVSLLTVVKKKREEKCLNSDADLDVRWMLLSGKTATPDSRSLLSKAVAIFHDRFDPIVDSATGRDLIPTMIYGRNKKGQDFGGMYCAVLTINSSVVSAGILRIFGQEVAELPLVATSSDYQGQGYFQSLFSCIERLLGFLNVKTLVLPAAGEAEAIWTDRFGFEKISDDQLSEYRKNFQMTVFQGTHMLQKAVPKCRIIDRSAAKS